MAEGKIAGQGGVVMSETKWTKGPWGIASFSKADKEISITDGFDGFCWVDYDDVDHEEMEANAHLIAASPDLYEALVKMLVRFVPVGQSDKAVEELAQAALRKARGEA